ncbi:MAG: hypothetical protein Q8R26_00850 [bacterium]|nr:hypothetical protein [bacterium]
MRIVLDDGASVAVYVFNSTGTPQEVSLARGATTQSPAIVEVEKLAQEEIPALSTHVCQVLLSTPSFKESSDQMAISVQGFLLSGLPNEIKNAGGLDGKPMQNGFGVIIEKPFRRPGKTGTIEYRFLGAHSGSHKSVETADPTALLLVNDGLYLYKDAPVTVTTSKEYKLLSTRCSYWFPFAHYQSEAIFEIGVGGGVSVLEGKTQTTAQYFQQFRPIWLDIEHVSIINSRFQSKSVHEYNIVPEINVGMRVHWMSTEKGARIEPRVILGVTYVQTSTLHSDIANNLNRFEVGLSLGISFL